MTFDFPKPESRFLKVKCGKCENTQVIFNSPAQEVNCSECGETLAEPTGGRGKILADVKKALE